MMFSALKGLLVKWLIDEQTIETIIEQLNKEFIDDDVQPSKNDSSLVYFIENTSDNLVKIGVSENPKRRLKSLQSATGNKLRLIATMKGGFEREREIHKMFKEQRKLGEWFTLTKEMLDFILATCDTSYTMKRKQLPDSAVKTTSIDMPSKIFEFTRHVYREGLIDDDGAVKRGVAVPWFKRGSFSQSNRLDAINVINRIEPPIFFYDEQRKWWFINTEQYPTLESIAAVLGVVCVDNDGV